MLAQLEKYWIIGSTLVVAYLVYMFWQRDKQWRDVQAELIKTKVEKKLIKLVENKRENLNDSKDKLRNYRDMLKRYQSVTSKRPGRGVTNDKLR